MDLLSNYVTLRALDNSSHATIQRVNALEFSVRPIAYQDPLSESVFGSQMLTWSSLFDQKQTTVAPMCRTIERKYEGFITLCSQKHEEDHLQLECRTPKLNWTLSNMLLLLQMLQVMVPRLEDMLDTLDMHCVKQSNIMPVDTCTQLKWSSMP